MRNRVNDRDKECEFLLKGGIWDSV